MPLLLPGNVKEAGDGETFEALKLIAATLAALFLGDLNILTGEPPDILVSWFLILISSDFHLYYSFSWLQ